MISKEFFENEIKQQLSQDDVNLIFEFFITFSRFECALKNTIEFANGNEKGVSADWDKFTKSIKASFNPDKNEKLKEAVCFITTEPPKIQVMQNKKLDWRPRSFNGDPLTTKLSLHIRDIRNNLFHGGKFDYNYPEDVSRNSTLIKSALIILNDWLELNNTVKAIFISPIR